MPLNLRMILLAVAAISLLGIIAESIRRNRMRRQQAVSHNESTSTDDLIDDGIVGAARVIQSADPSYRPTMPKAPECLTPLASDDIGIDEPEESTTPYLQNASQNDLIVFYIMPKVGQKISGRDLKDILLRLDLEYSNMRIFNHYVTQHNFKDLQFCIASAFEPGTFNLQQMPTENYQGLCCFMSANHRRAEAAYTNMLTTLDQIVKTLDANLCDDKREPCGNAYIAKCQQQFQKNA